MKHFSTTAKKRGMRIIACSAALCLGAGALVFGVGKKASTAYAEQPDCSFDHNHKIVTGVITGDEYEVGELFGSDIAFEAPKLPSREEIIVDGFKDDIWDEYDEYAITTLAGTDFYGNWKGSGVTGKVQYMWDDWYLYVWVEIYDPTVNIGRSGANAWGDSKGDNLEFFLDTLHTDELVDYNANDGLYPWDGADGAVYRGGDYDYKIDPKGEHKDPNLLHKDNETTMGMAPDGGNYQDFACGKYRASGGANQTGESDHGSDLYYTRDNKINDFVANSGNRDGFGDLTDRRGCGDGNRVEWAPYTELSSLQQWAGDSNFTSAYIFDDWDIHDPYERGETYNLDAAEREYNSLKSEIGGGREAIGFTFEAKFEFKSELYMPTAGSVIGVGLNYEDWKSDDNGWLGGYRATFGLENLGSCSYDYVRVAPLNLSNLALLPGEDDVVGGGPTADNKDYTVSFLDGTETIYSWTGKKGTTVPTPPSPSKEGYVFEGWTGFSDGYTIIGNKSFRAKWSAIVNEFDGELPYASSYQQNPDLTYLDDGTELCVFNGERTTAPIEVDGNLDDAYLEAIAIPLITNYTDAKTDVWGYAYFVYDNQYFYVFVVVFDENVTTNGPRGFSDGDGYAGLEARWDNVTLFVDTWNKPSGEHQGMGGDYRGDYEGEGRFRLNAGDNQYSTSNGGFSPGYHPMGYEPWMMNDSTLTKLGASQVIDGVGYTAEFKIGWASFNGSAADGKQIAFALVITDGDGTEDYVQTAKVGDAYHYNPDWEVGTYSKLDLDNRVEPEVTVTYPSDKNYTPFVESKDDGKDDEKEKGGCGSAIGLGTGAMLVALLGGTVAVVLVRKKKTDK